MVKLSHAERRRGWSEIWMLKPVFQEAGKFRAMAKPGCEDESRGESDWRMRSRD